MGGRRIGKRERAAIEHVGGVEPLPRLTGACLTDTLVLKAPSDGFASNGFPIAARVLVDGRDEAIVKAHFPKGSSSFLFPHYKVDFVKGDSNVAVNESRIGATLRPLVLVRLDDGNLPGGPAIVIEVRFDRNLTFLSDRDGCRDARLRIWEGRVGVAVGDRMSLGGNGGGAS
jgi:hypothetical protein